MDKRTVTSADFSNQQPIDAFWSQEIAKGKYRCIRHGGWASEQVLDVIAPELDSMIIESLRDPRSGSIFGRLGKEAVSISINGGNFLWSVALPKYDKSAIEKWEKLFLKHYPVTVPPDDNSIPFTFWMATKRGHQNYRRTLEVPLWNDIQNNYANPTQENLEQIFSDFKPSHGGQLILWHGVPGTGKTYAIRALAQKWKDWCNFECVVDPEAFFRDAEYMTGVMLEGPNITLEEIEGNSKDRRQRYRILVLEDAGELLAENARERTGQGLSRLLNVVDGLIGQGLKILILVTTNEPMEKLHPAIARPGRCAASVEFVKFNQEGANQWLEDKGVELKMKKDATLAELYGSVKNFSGGQLSEKARIGFSL